jgi:hypothetical protein
MGQRFKPGDFLFFQLESGFALIRLLDVAPRDGDIVWHLAAFHDLFPDVEMIEQAISEPDRLSVSIPHVALTNRAFESTQVADIGNSPVTETEMRLIADWESEPERKVSDLSIRLLTGLR